MQKTAVIILADGFEEIEAMTPIDILRRAGVKITIAGLNPDNLTVTSSRGIVVQAETALNQFDADIDAIILPGGPGTKLLAESDRVRSLVLDMHHHGKIIAAICAAPALVLAPLGILDHKKATCYPSMEENFNNSTAFSEDRVVVDGNIITSRGPGTALAFALAITQKLVGEKIAQTLTEKTLANL